MKSQVQRQQNRLFIWLCVIKKGDDVITFSSSFHGNNIGTKIFGGLNTRKYLEGWNGGAIIAPYPHSDFIPAGMTEEQYTEYCLHYLEHHIPNYIAEKDNIAAIMVEPGLAEGGNWIPTKKFLKGIRGHM